MNWDALGALGETLGALLVLITLIYLTVEDAIRADAMSTYWFWLHWGQFTSTNRREDLLELGETIGKFYQSPAIKYAWENGPFSKPLLSKEFIVFVEEYMAIFSEKIVPKLL